MEQGGEDNPRKRPMTCKCKARTYEGHLKKIRAGYPGHAYHGAIWRPGL